MEYLNETATGDLLKIIDAFAKVITTEPEDGSKAIAILKNATSKSKYRGSITSQANKLSMTFPVLVSNTISYSTASMLSKAIERKCTLMLQQLFAADILVANANSGGIQQQINNIYTGIDFDTLSVDDLINITDTISAKDGKLFYENAYMKEVAELVKKKINAPAYESSVNENSVALYKVNEHGNAEVDREMVITEAKNKKPKSIRSTYKFEDNISFDVNTVVTNATDYLKANHISDKVSRQIMKDIKNGVNAGDDDKINTAIARAIDLSNNSRASAEAQEKFAKDMAQFKLDIEKHKLNAAEHDLNQKKINADIALNYRKFEYEKERDIKKDEFEKARQELENDKLRLAKRQDSRAALTARNDYFKKQLLDTDVKKCNELVPSMLIVNYAIKTGDDVVESSAIVGVKTRVIALDSFEILDKLAAKNKDKSGFVKFIRATSGEIKFMKDFVLAVDKAKIDALNKSKRGSANPIWKILERRAAVNNLRKALGQKNDASPITVLVVTQEEVDYLRKSANMDLDDVKTANYIINSFNLMGICIVDEASEVAKFLFDGEFNQFDMYSFGSLEKEAGDNGMYKKIINLMSKRM